MVNQVFSNQALNTLFRIMELEVMQRSTQLFP